MVSKIQFVENELLSMFAPLFSRAGPLQEALGALTYLTKLTLCGELTGKSDTVVSIRPCVPPGHLEKVAAYWR